jgi:hypothetical protein
VEWVATCVEPVTGFALQPDTALAANGSVMGLTAIPGASPDPDVIAVLSQGSDSASVEVQNPVKGGRLAGIAYPGEQAHAILGFSFQLGPNDHMGTQPALAVATSVTGAQGSQVRLHVYAWTNGQLVEQAGSPFVVACGQSMCGGGAAVDCTLQLQFAGSVHLDASDVDGDRFADLAIGTSDGLPLTIYSSREGRASGQAMYAEQGCACARYGQAPAPFELVRLGTPRFQADPPLVDLVIGEPFGAFLTYGAPDAAHNEVLACMQSVPIGVGGAIRDLTRGRFQCDSYFGAGGGCENYEDVVIVGSKVPVRIVYGSGMDLTSDPRVPDLPGSRIELDPRPISVSGARMPLEPDVARTGMINRDHFDDLAVLYSQSREVHVWLGAGNKALGEVALPIDVGCAPIAGLALADLDGSGSKQIAVVCDGGGSAAPFLRRFVAE